MVALATHIEKKEVEGGGGKIWRNGEEKVVVEEDTQNFKLLMLIQCASAAIFIEGCSNCWLQNM